VFNQEADVVAAFSECRQVNVVHVEPIEQVAPELAGIHGGLDVQVRGRHEPHVDAAHLVLANPAHFSGLERPEQLRLQPCRHRADLVEKECPAARMFNEAGSRTPGSRERPLRVAEEIVLEE
jgi:hypothetical protein